MSTPQSSVLCLLCVILALCVDCAPFRRSECEDDSSRVGCNVSISVTPTRIPLRAEAALKIQFDRLQKETVALLRESAAQLLIRLHQGDVAISLAPVVFEEETLAVRLSRDQSQELKNGEADVELATAGGSVFAKTRFYLEPRLGFVLKEENTGDRKWAGLRRTATASKIVLIESTGSGGQGVFVEYQLAVNQNDLARSMLGSAAPTGVQGTFDMATSRVSSGSHFTNNMAGNLLLVSKSASAQVLGTRSANAPPPFLDPMSNIVSLVTDQGFAVYLDASRGIKSDSLQIQKVRQCAFANVDQDGLRDLIVTTGEHQRAIENVLFFVHDGMGHLTERPSLAEPLKVPLQNLGPLDAMAAGDFDGDGTPDLIMASGGNLYWLPIGVETPALQLQGIPVNNVVRLEALDLNDDGLCDLAVVTDNDATIYLNTAR